MFKRRRTANPKHRFASALEKADLKRLAKTVHYGGNPEHKRNPGDFGVSEQVRNGFPQNVWAVTDDGIALEAQLENLETGTYHGYPIREDDAFREKVIEKWSAYRA